MFRPAFRTPVRLRRDLHPGAWWIWALAMATATTRTTNPLLIGLTLAVVALVVSERRSDAPWAKGFGAYFAFGLVIIGIRLVFRMFLDGQHGTHILFTLPEIPLPEAAAGIRIGGPVSLEGMLAALYDGLRLATMLICIGAANVLANPKRLLKSVPSALYEVGSAITVALSVAPQLVESGRRVARARRLRGEVGRRTHWVRQVAIPVMTDALDRSLALAAAMDSRGYGRTAGASRGSRRVTGALMLVGLAGLCAGTYGLLDTTAFGPLTAPMLIGGVAACAAGIRASGSQVQRTRYRPDPWALPEWGVAAVGTGVAVVIVVTSSIDPNQLNPSLQPLVWPSLPPIPTIAILCGALAAVIAPPPAWASRSTGFDLDDDADLGTHAGVSTPDQLAALLRPKVSR
ncbi:MAG: hypothetical protein M9952_15810 [Microthrixaceae bacterium]|nr:hypothetical protein [Microthrixaceae bacterium]